MTVSAEKVDFANSNGNVELTRAAVDRQVLDLEHLTRYTMADAALEAELLGLFRDQAIAQFDNIEQAANKPDWVMAVHTLKGSARSIGARQVAKLTADLEKNGFDGSEAEKSALTSELKQAMAVCVVTIETLTG